MPAYSRIMQARDSQEPPPGGNDKPPERREPDGPLQLEVVLTRFRPFGPNLILTDLDTRESHFARTSPRQVLRAGFRLYKDRHLKVPSHIIRPRVGYEIRGRSFDLYEILPKGEYHLGSIHRRSPRVLEPGAWELRNWEDETIARYEERAIVSVLGAHFRAPRFLAPTTTMHFLVSGKPHGRIIHKVKPSGIVLTTDFSLRPPESHRLDLLRYTLPLLALL